MVKKLHKKIALRIGVLASGAVALILGYTHRNSLQDVASTVLDNPIFGIEKVYAEDGSSGGCSGCSTCDAPTYPSPVVSDAVFSVTEE